MKRYYEYDGKYMDIHYSLSEHPKKENFYMHTHESCEVYYFIHGKGVFRIEGSAYPLKSGDIFILRNAESHYIDIDENYPYERMALHFDECLLTNIDPEKSLLTPFYQRDGGKFNRFTHNDFKTNGYQIFLQNIITSTGENHIQIITNLLPLLNELYLSFSSRNNTHDRDPLEYQIVSYINSHITEHLCLDDICKEFFISKSQLCKIFKMATGSTVWDYIILKRLIYVKDLIHSGIVPTKAATMGGFTDYSVFYRNYRKKYNCSPSDEFYASKQLGRV